MMKSTNKKSSTLPTISVGRVLLLNDYNVIHMFSASGKAGRLSPEAVSFADFSDIYVQLYEYEPLAIGLAKEAAVKRDISDD